MCAGLDEVSESWKSKTMEGFEHDLENLVLYAVLNRESVSVLECGRLVHRVRVYRWMFSVYCYLSRYL